MWASSVLKLYRRMFGSATDSGGHPSGVEHVLDGATAVAVTEASIAETAGLGGTFPAHTAGAAWRSEQAREGTNFFGLPLASQDAGTPRGALAATLGSSLSGLRAAAFLSGPDLSRSHDLLHMAAARHLPLILHLGARAADGAAVARGSGHEAYHGAADCGCIQFFARNTQQAVDFTLIARRTAEHALVPVIVAMDGEQTSEAVQEVSLPPPELVREFLGSPHDIITTPTEAQKLLFGTRRRRVPRIYDLDRPLLVGGFQGPEAWGLAVAGQAPFFNDHVPDIIEQSLTELHRRTGRMHDLISSHQVENARVVLVAQGATVETAEAVAEWLLRERKQKVGVIGIHCLRPFPATRALELLKGKPTVAVLERVAAPVGAEPPLLREIRAAVDRALENGRFGGETHSGFPAWSQRDCPRLHSVVYGLGGRPLRGADVVALCSELESKGRSRVYLGLEFAPASSPYPKRQALLDQIRRAYPQVADLAIRSKEPSPDTRPEGSLTVAVHRMAGRGGADLADEAAALLHRLAGGHVRSRPSTVWARFAQPEVDVFTHSRQPLRDPGDDMAHDVAVIAVPDAPIIEKALAKLRAGGTVLVIGQATQALRHLEATVLAVDDGDHREERLLGALASQFASRFDLKPKRISAVRSEMLSHLPETERQICLAAFEAGLGGVREPERRSDETSTQAIGAEPEVPMAVRLLGRSAESTLDSLPRFWDQVGVLYQSGETEDLTADPYQTAGAIPPLTSTFHDFSPARNMLPELDPSLCTGCGACWTFCPDGAVAPVVMTPAALLEAAMAMSGADALRPVVGQLANRVSAEVKKADPAPTRAREPLDQAFQWLLEKMPMPDERKQAVQGAYEKIAGRVGNLPISRTSPFFDEPETRSKGSGELLSLAVNPNACKACGVCIEVCEPQALKEQPQSPRRVEAARHLWKLWESLPDTPGETIDRVRENPDVGPTAAMLLARSCLLAMAGGDGAEAGSGERIVLRLALAAAEYHQQPIVRRLLGRVEEAREKMAQRIRHTLADALPTSDLDALAQGIDLLGSAAADLPALMERIHGAVEQGRVDTKRLRRQVEIAQHLADDAWRLKAGAHGMGRSRVGLAVAADLRSSWLGAFPDNPFSVPAVVDPSGDTPHLALGLVEGQIRTAVEAVIALRKAELELNRPEEAEREIPKLDAASWRDLSPEERAACPPLLLVGREESLGGRALLELLETDLPIKAVILADMSLGLDGSPGIDLAAAAIGLRNVFVAQTSMAAPKHFYECTRDALEHPGPALLRVHAPSPARHGFEMRRVVEQAALAIRSRAFVLFRYDPRGPGVFGLHLDLDGNPEAKVTWVDDETRGPLTPAHWAITESRFARFFRCLDEGVAGPTPFADYALLPKEQRSGKTPFITLDDGARRAVAPELARAIEERLSLWRTLQEVAGVVTPFTDKVRADAEKAVAEAHQAELRSLREEYEDKIRSLGDERQAEIAKRIRNQLLVLTGYKK